MRITVYISGAITRGNKLDNFVRFCKTFEVLVDLGFAPMNPGLTMLHPGAFEIPHATWLEIDLPWVLQADAVLRLAGSSAGADKECEAARTHGIPVFTSIEDLESWAKLTAVRRCANS